MSSGASTGPGRRSRTIEGAAVAGIASAVLGTLALAAFNRYPSLSSTDEELTRWFDDSTNQALLIGGLALMSFSSIALLWFVAVIRRRLGELEDRFFGTVFLGSAIVCVVIQLVGAAAAAAPATAMNTLDAAAVSPTSVTLAGGLAAALLLAILPRIQAVFMFTTSTVILRTRVLPRWVALTGYIIGLLMIATPVVWRPMALPFEVWVLLVSIGLLVARRPQPGGSRSR